jgi:hypothetical protein
MSASAVARTGERRPNVVPSPNPPFAPLPQVQTEPSARSATEWVIEVAMAVAPDRPGTRTGTALLVCVPSPS